MSREAISVYIFKNSSREVIRTEDFVKVANLKYDCFYELIYVVSRLSGQLHLIPVSHEKYFVLQ